MKRTALVLIISAVLTATVWGRNQNVENVPFAVGDKRIAEAWMNELDKKGIPYTIPDLDSVLIAKENSQEAHILLVNVTKKLIPPNRNAFFPPEDLAIVKAVLDEKGLMYDVLEVFGIEALIWDEEDSEAIQRVLSGLPVRRIVIKW